jgi:putative nucleotidyltransferase with HDIG domain
MLFLLIVFILLIGFTLGLKVAQSAKNRNVAYKNSLDTDKNYNPSNRLDKYTIQFDPDILEKKMLYDQELSLLLKVGQELSGNVKIKEISKIVVENIKKALNVEKCALLLLDPKTDRLRIEYSFGLTAKDIKNADFKKGESISGWTAKNNDALIIKNIERDYWIKMMNKERYYTRSLISIPLSVKNRVFGVLNVNNKLTAEEFSQDDLRMLREMTSQAAVAIQNARLYEELEEGYFLTIKALAAALDAKDPYTARHSENVTRYAIAIAKELRLTELELENIRRAALLHDIGKIGIPDSILLKSEKLTEEEYAKIKTHAVKGEEIIGSLVFLKDVALYVRHHHEKFDGSGYPDGKKGYQIELAARILAVSDAFDTMVSNRPYRRALSLQDASEELKRHSGTQFDPELVDILLGIIKKNPKLVI